MGRNMTIRTGTPNLAFSVFKFLWKLFRNWKLF